MGDRPGSHDPKESEANMDNASFRSKYKNPTWRSIINTDIKLENVVLSQPIERYPAYPVAKMMDFGICVRSQNPKEKIKFTEKAGGTAGLEPPVRTHSRKHSKFCHLRFFIGAATLIRKWLRVH